MDELIKGVFKTILDAIPVNVRVGVACLIPGFASADIGYHAAYGKDGWEFQLTAFILTMLLPWCAFACALYLVLPPRKLFTKSDGRGSRPPSRKKSRG